MAKSDVLTLSEALAMRRGKRLVFTNGVFDILHAGHVRYLAQAAALGDLLIVGVNDDESVRRLGKGPERPINPLEDRCAVLEALRSVSGTVPFSEDNPIAVVEALQPEVHVKGGDYRADELPESRVIRAYGGEVVILPLLKGRSTTRVAKQMRGSA